MKKTLAWAKKHKEIVALIALPLFMTVMVALVYVLPTAFKHPGYDFVYVQCADYCYSVEYRVIDGELTKPSYYEYNRFDEYDSDEPEDTFYYYDIETNQKEKITYEEAQRLEFTDSLTAPDGFKIERGSYSGGDIFFGGYDSDDYNKFYAVNGAAKRELNLESRNYSDIEIIGWVVSDAR